MRWTGSKEGSPIVEICSFVFDLIIDGTIPEVMSLPEFNAFAHDPNPNAIKDIIKTIKSFPAFLGFIETPHLLEYFFTLILNLF